MGFDSEKAYGITGRFGAERGSAGAITDIVFDFCDVLLNWDPRGAFGSAGLMDDNVWEEFFDRSAEFGFWHYDELLDLGMPKEDVIADYRAHHAGEAGENAFDVYFLQHAELAFRGMIPGMDYLLGNLSRNHYRLWGLTNFTTEAVQYALTQYPAMRLLKDVVVSSEERDHKPDASIYQTAIERFDLDPASSVFLDDKPWNVEAAQKLGFHSFVFTDAVSARSLLAQLGVRVL